ncbi:MAG: BON domain-containing protein [Dehalococcoidia bacterium]|nr:BON domain-containing protein [Dehalococcoidia bacterium]
MTPSNPSAADARLARDILEALDDTEPIEAVGHRIEVTVVDGVARLTGVVRTEVLRHLAGQVAAGVRGVVAVQNDLLSDQTIARQVAAALARDPIVADRHILVQSTLGAVTLRGVFPTAAEADRAVAIARETPGVVEVTIGELQPD